MPHTLGDPHHDDHAKHLGFHADHQSAAVSQTPRPWFRAPKQCHRGWKLGNIGLDMCVPQSYN
jgi:hypothetical protein